MYRRFGVAALVALGAVAAPAAPASAATVHCGDHISTNIVLSNDLTCVGTALHLVIAENQTLTVNLNGHQLKGNGTGTGLETDLFKPANTSIAGNLVVTNGTITGFAVALVGPGTYSPGLLNLTARKLKLTSNAAWQPMRVRYATVIENSVVTDSGSGGAYTDSSSMTARNTIFTRSSISSASESYNYLYGNTFSGGGFGGSTMSTVIATGNTFRDCNYGITMNDSWTTPMQIENNIFQRCQTGLRLNGMLGPIVVQGNSFLDNKSAGMTYLNAFHRKLTIAGNSFLRNGADGLTGADTNVGPGPVAGSGPTTVTGNIANRNVGLGLNFTGVVTDGGGNRAQLNGNPAQCVGVVCTP
jgi:hypothetical protein